MMMQISKSKCSRELYCSFLEITSTRYSALSLSEAAPKKKNLSHDNISRWLTKAKIQPKNLRKLQEKK